MQRPRPIVDPALLAKCTRLQQRIKQSEFAKYMSLILMILVMIVTFVAGLCIIGANEPQSITVATFIFVGSAIISAMLTLVFIFCPTPNKYGSELLVAANQLPDGTQALITLKSQLVQEGVNAVAWKF